MAQLLWRPVTQAEAGGRSGEGEGEVVEPLAMRPGLLRLALQNTKRACKVAARTVYLCFIFTPLFLALPMSWYDATREAWWVWCVRTVELSGALCIKLAQWASSRPDLFGACVCEKFRHLQASRLPVSAHRRATISDWLSDRRPGRPPTR